jgi:hypothetical protein
LVAIITVRENDFKSVDDLRGRFDGFDVFFGFGVIGLALALLAPSLLGETMFILMAGL